MSEIENLVQSERPAPTRGRSLLWTSLAVTITLFLVIANLLAWQHQRTQRIQQQHDQRVYDGLVSQLSDAQGKEAELKQLRSDVIDKHKEVQLLLRSFRRPTMVKALQAELVDLDLSETIVVHAVPEPRYGKAFFLWTPDAGQSLSIAMKTSGPADEPLKSLSPDDSSVVEKIIVEPLVPKRLHFIRYQLARAKDGSELQVMFDGRPLYTQDLQGFPVGSSSSSGGSDSVNTFSEPNLVQSRFLLRKLSTDQIASGIWLPIYDENYNLRHQGLKKWKRVKIECTLQSAGPLFVQRPDRLRLGPYFDYERYFELHETDRSNIQEIISVKPPLGPSSK